MRAISGRSPIAAILRGAASLDNQGEEDTPLVVVDRAARVGQQALARHELRALRELAGELTDDQRLVLACQVSLGMDCAEFCERYGWSALGVTALCVAGAARHIDVPDFGPVCATASMDSAKVVPGQSGSLRNRRWR